MAECKTKSFSIDEVTPGMYVSELDVSWIKAPFFRHRRLISNQNDIKLLRSAGVKNIVVDLSKSKLNEPQSPPVAKSEMKEELKVATEIEKETIEKVEEVHSKIKQGEEVDLKEFNPIIAKTFESLGRNNKALLALVSKSQENDKLVSHHFRVLSLASAIALKIGYDERKMEHLALAALLHDSGWVKLPKQLFTKGKPYKPAERKLVEQHVTIIQKTLSQQEELDQEVISIIEQHHERGDGSGYPKKLSLYQIHPSARLLAICDYYDELTHGLGEQPGIVPKKALGILYKDAVEGRFDDKLVSEAIHLMGVYPIGSAVLLNTGEKAVIIDLNDHDPIRPIIKICYDKVSQALAHPITVNLLKQKRSETERSLEKIIAPNKSNDPANILIWTEGDLP